jgi:hypothetical protein
MPEKQPGGRKSSGRKKDGEPAPTTNTTSTTTTTTAKAAPKIANRSRPAPGEQCRERACALLIAERLRKGEPLAAILRAEGMPTHDALAEWRAQDADIERMISRAREEGFDALAAECLAIADDAADDTLTDAAGKKRVDTEAIQRAKLRIETRLKLLSKWCPRKYGDKVEVTGEGMQTEVTVNVAQSEERRRELIERRRIAMEAGNARK